MSNLMNDLIASQITINRLLWIMDDETADSLLLLTQTHLRLVQEAIEPSCDGDRKKAIEGEILVLRTLRDSIIHQFEENYIQLQSEE
jgi:hypothetical protein